MTPNGQTKQSLGFPSDARLLIVNADDLGMCHAVNEAIFHTLKNGIARSTSLMVPCPWMLHATRFLADNPEIPFGIHLTAISEWADCRWGPVTATEKVPSLLDRDLPGQARNFYSFEQMPGFLAQVRLDQLEMEFRAQNGF